MTEVEHSLIHDGGWQNNINNEKIDEEELANNSAKLFERSRIKALAGKVFYYFFIMCFMVPLHHRVLF